MTNQLNEIDIFKPLIPKLLKIAHQNQSKSNFSVTTKSDSSTVTSTDKEFDHLITQVIAHNLPNDIIISEEVDTNHHDTTNSGRVWIIDPICGTENFAKGIPLYCTNIALYQNNQPEFSIVIDYLKQTYYWTSFDHPHIFNRSQVIKLPKLPNKTIDIDNGYVPLTGSDLELQSLGKIISHLINAKWTTNELGTSLAFTYTALNLFSAFICPKAHMWDFAAANAFIKKSGGVTTNFKGEPWNLQHSSIIASNDPNTHQQLLEIVQQYLTED